MSDAEYGQDDFVFYVVSILDNGASVPIEFEKMEDALKVSTQISEQIYLWECVRRGIPIPQGKTLMHCFFGWEPVTTPTGVGRSNTYTLTPSNIVACYTVKRKKENPWG